MYWTQENMNPFYVKQRLTYNYEKPFGWSYRKILRFIFTIICVVNIISLFYNIHIPKVPKNSSNHSSKSQNIPNCFSLPSSSSSSSSLPSPSSASSSSQENVKPMKNIKEPSKPLNFKIKKMTISEQREFMNAYPQTNVQAYSIVGFIQVIGFIMNFLIRIRGLLAIGVFKGCDEPRPFGIQSNIIYSDRKESFSGCIFFIGGMILLLTGNILCLFKVTLFEMICHCILTLLGILFLAFSIDDNRSTIKGLSNMPWRSTPDLSNCSLPTLPADDDLQQHCHHIQPQQQQAQQSVALNMWT